MSLSLHKIYLGFTDQISHFGELFKKLMSHEHEKNFAKKIHFYFCNVIVFRVWSVKDTSATQTNDQVKYLHPFSRAITRGSFNLMPSIETDI